MSLVPWIAQKWCLDDDHLLVKCYSFKSKLKIGSGAYRKHQHTNQKRPPKCTHNFHSNFFHFLSHTFFPSNHVILFVVHQIMAITMSSRLVISHHGPSSPSIGPRRFQASTTEATNHHCPIFGRPRGLLLGTVDRAPPWRQLQQTIARADHGGKGLCLGSFDLFVLNTGWTRGPKVLQGWDKEQEKFQKISDSFPQKLTNWMWKNLNNNSHSPTGLWQQNLMTKIPFFSGHCLWTALSEWPKFDWHDLTRVHGGIERIFREQLVEWFNTGTTSICLHIYKQ